MDQSQMADCIRQNQENVFEDKLLKAFESLCNSKEQSYEEFLNSFIYLTKDDVNKQQRPATTLEEPLPTVINKKDKPANYDVLVEQDSIDEQELDDGTKMPDFLTRSTGTGNIQLDNYVDEESSPLNSEEENEEFSPRYVASFSTKKDNVVESKRDSTGELLPDDQSIVSESLSARQALPTGDLVYPGEVEEIPVTPREDDIKRSTQLDFTTTCEVNSDHMDTGDLHADVDASNNEAVIKSQSQECDDYVKPFQLDESFDYDNIILTPKYSSEDLNHMAPDLRERFDRHT